MGYEEPSVCLRGSIHRLLVLYLLRLPEEDMPASWGMNSAYTWSVEEFRKSPDLRKDAPGSKEKQRLRRKKIRCYEATFWEMYQRTNFKIRRRGNFVEKIERSSQNIPRTAPESVRTLRNHAVERLETREKQSCSSFI